MTWSRPYGSSLPFCVVTQRDELAIAPAVHTACNGRWVGDARDEEHREAPTKEERCGRCWSVEQAKERAVVELERFEAGLVAAEANNGGDAR
jgi:hypothetical protein